MIEEQEIYKIKVFPALRSQAILFYFGKKLLISVFLKMTRKIKVSYSNKSIMEIIKAGFSILSMFSYFML